MVKMLESIATTQVRNPLSAKEVYWLTIGWSLYAESTSQGCHSEDKMEERKTILLAALGSLLGRKVGYK